MLAALLSVTVIAAPSTIHPARTFSPALVTGPAIAPFSPVHLGLVFKLTHSDELEALLQAQQDPSSPDYRRWLTPDEFGRRFGQSDALIERTRAWLQSNGFEVTTYPNRSFVEAIGTAEHVHKLFGIRLLGVVAKPAAVHVPEGPPVPPAWIARQLLHVAGLDTRPRFHHRMWDSYGDTSLGPQDLRAQYDVWPVLDAGFYGQGQDLIVLSEAEAPGKEVQAADIAYFYLNVSDADVTFSENVLANPDGDYDIEDDGRLEFELDSEMQSVGSPGAKSIMLEVAPASEVFSVGVQDIVNNYPNATAISISLGLCESDVTAFGDQGVTAMRQGVMQGVAEGQTWSAASGDNGADDCEVNQAPATVDFPCVIPEIVAMGGSQIDPVTFDQNIALNSTQTEEVWNDFELFGPGGGAGGGGISTLFKAPAYQSSFGLTGRSVPDLSLIAGSPSTIAVTNRPGWFGPIDGTSVASPLSAGFFGLIASGVGCRLGDPHTVLYNMGAGQVDGGGAVVFNDIVSGDNSADGVTGFAAAAGYDSASGWGSMDVAALLKAWPACPADAGTSPGTSGPSYSQCTFIGCDSGCVTLPQGPSTCNFVSCDPTSATNDCPAGEICTASGPYAADGDGGACFPGCLTTSDCIDGGVCDLCFNICVPTGTATAQIGDPCESPDDCPPGGTCLLWTGYYDSGYCSAPCDSSDPNPACACPAGSTCFGMTTQDNMPFNACLGGCIDGGCRRPGYVCQPEAPGPSSCQPACEANQFFDTCEIYSVSGTACDNENGTCYPPTGTSSGVSATGTSSGGRTTGTSSGGHTSSGGRTSSGTTEGTSSGGTGTSTSTGSSTGSSAGTPGTTGTAAGTTSAGMIEVKSVGCNCSSGGSPDIVLGLFVLLGLTRRRRQ
jgi:MYXO-CTERM domain-containing protein